MTTSPAEAPAINAPLCDLPEELILAILSWLEKQDLLLASRICRQLNRLVIPMLFREVGILNPSAFCKIVLQDRPTRPDALTILSHSVHIKAIKDLSLYFTTFPSYASLGPPLRRAIFCVRNLTVAEEVTLYFGSRENAIDSLRNEKIFKELVPLFEELLNTIILLSTKKLRIFGSEGLLGQYYSFQAPPQDEAAPLSPDSATVHPRSVLRALSLSQRLRGAKDYFDRRQHKNSEDAIIQDDLRYTRSSMTGSRILLRCSPSALQQSQLTHVNLGTTDFLRPPFSQWTLSMLRASQIQSISFSFAHLPKTQAEVEFVLNRLSAVLPRLTRLYLFEITEAAMPTLVKWVNTLSTLERLQIEPFGNAELTTKARLPELPGLPTYYTFAPKLKRIDGPHKFLVYFFKVASLSNNPRPDAAIGNSTKETDTGKSSPTGSCDALDEPSSHLDEPQREDDPPTHLPPSSPTSTVVAPALSSLASTLTTVTTPLFPVLELVHLDYYCIKGTKFNISVLADAIHTIRPDLSAPVHSTTALTVADAPLSTASILVHLKFDKHFWGLAEAEAEALATSASDSASMRTIRANPAAHRLLPSIMSPTTDTSTYNVPPVYGTPLHTLSLIDKVRVGLPGTRTDILSGAFNAQILSILTVFWGCKNLRLVSVDHGGAVASSKERMHQFFGEFKERNGRLKRVDVSVVGKAC